MASLQLLLVRLSPLRDQRPQVFAGQTTADLAQVEEEDIINLTDCLCGSELPPDRLQVLSHR